MINHYTGTCAAVTNTDFPELFDTFGYIRSTRRRRRLWCIVGSNNGIAYYRNRDGWFIPVGTIEEVTS